MKKIIGITCLMLALCLVACSSTLPSPTETKTREHETEAKPTVEKKTEEEILPEGPHDPTGFSVGFARVEANPPAGTGLGGFANNASRVSAVIQDDIMITCICISDGESKVLLFSLDTLSVSEAVWNQIASQTQKKLGIPRENIILNCTHTHSAPTPYPNGVGNEEFMKLYNPAVVRAAQQALAELGLADAGHKYPGELSGGMQQRVSLARALVLEGDLLILDEPFKAMDDALRREVITRVARTDAAILLVTHDREEAELLGCEIIELK